MDCSSSFLDHTAVSRNVGMSRFVFVCLSIGKWWFLQKYYFKMEQNSYLVRLRIIFIGQGLSVQAPAGLVLCHSLFESCDDCLVVSWSRSIFWVIYNCCQFLSLRNEVRVVMHNPTDCDELSVSKSDETTNGQYPMVKDHGYNFHSHHFCIQNLSCQFWISDWTIDHKLVSIVWFQKWYQYVLGHDLQRSASIINCIFHWCLAYVESHTHDRHYATGMYTSLAICRQ